MAEIVSNNLPKTLKDRVSEAYWWKRPRSLGRACEHLALRNDLVDAQVWIAKGDKPVLQRLVLTYKLENGQPQFWANFHDWNFVAGRTGFARLLSPLPKGRRGFRLSPAWIRTQE